MKFARKDTKKCHENVHLGIKPFQCCYCPKRFGLGSDRKIHERIHTKERPYSCSFCEKSFTTKSQRVSHERGIHTKEKPYPCYYCEKRFSTASNRVNHMRAIHKEAFTEDCKNSVFDSKKGNASINRNKGVKKWYLACWVAGLAKMGKLAICLSWMF